MARGRLLKTKVKEEKALTSARTKAYYKSKAVAIDKLSFFSLIKQSIPKVLDKIDPLELAAVGSLTFLIKPIIQKIPEVANYMTANLPFGLDIAVESFQEGSINIFTLKNPITGEIIYSFSIPIEGSTPVNTDIARRIPDISAYLFAFALSLLIIKYPQALTMAENGVVGLARLVAGVGA